MFDLIGTFTGSVDSGPAIVRTKISTMLDLKLLFQWECCFGRGTCQNFFYVRFEIVIKKIAFFMFVFI